jgi:hypothetical protein
MPISNRADGVRADTEGGTCIGAAEWPCWVRVGADVFAQMLPRSATMRACGHNHQTLLPEHDAVGDADRGLKP